MNMQLKKRQLTLSIALALGTAATSVYAEADSEAKASSEDIEQISILGSRVSGRTAEESAVPVDIISSEQLNKSGFTELGQSLQASAPSFNFTRTQVSDGSDLFRPATLRGLQPDQTLVLINGKRRHTQSIFGNAGTVGGGSAGTDMNSIPLIALQAVDVLRDGAAAQYGSDAIAGVINLRLKDTTNETTGFVQWGSTSQGDGDKLTLGLNTGFDLGSDGGFVNLSGEFRDFERTNRADNPLWHQGDADGEFKSFFYNSMLPLGEGQLYSFGGVSQREALGSGFRRSPNSAAQNVPQVYPDGFTPNIDNEAVDISVAVGYRQELSDDWNLDASIVYGQNEYEFASRNTINPSFSAEYLFNNPNASDADIAANSGPTEGHSATFEFNQTTANLDISGEIELDGEPLFVAFGAEYRHEEYRIGRGVLASYACGSSNSVTAFPSVIDPNAFASCGFEAYPGISPDAETNTERDNYGLYLDVERYMTDQWLLSAAVRFEDYQVIGSNTTYKLASRYDITEYFGIRGALSTGFRAPSLPQRDYQAFTTNINNDGSLSRTFTAASGSALPIALGIDNLDIEESTSISLGFVASVEDVTVTLDAYQVEIDDRISLGSGIGAAALAGNQAALNALEATGVAEARIFSNAVNTKTSGVDLIVTYETDLVGGEFNTTFAANYNKTDIESLNIPAGSTALQVAPSTSRSFLVGGQPKQRATLNFDWSKDALSSVLRFNYYGSTEVDFFAGNHIPIPNTQPTSIVESAMLVDLAVAYDISDSLTLSAGVDNIFDQTPDELASNEVLDIISGGAFRYPLRAVPYGFNGSSYYAKLSFSF